MPIFSRRYVYFKYGLIYFLTRISKGRRFPRLNPKYLTPRHHTTRKTQNKKNLVTGLCGKDVLDVLYGRLTSQ